MMMAFRSVLFFLIASFATVSAFTTPRKQMVSTKVSPPPGFTSEPAFLFKKPKEEEDWSDIEVRDMTREEMSRLNDENERIMNAELWGMTIFSLILSLPMFYLVWVGFFSETSEMNIDM
mmetsp:Transcript_255/g.483  ORF Transcript_255/g.483 Transcript_255/m.483 type:complete len:119 (+) Transcript_255:170-526(+)